MLCITVKWLYLHLGSRSCWAKKFKILWVHRCVVVLHVLDYIRRQQLPSTFAKRWLEEENILIMLC
jgi:hypothetical protein